MRRGCISSGEVQCDECRQVIPFPERYLIIEETGTMLRLCVDCSLKKGYASYKREKGESVVTFFGEEVNSAEKKEEKQVTIDS